MKVTFIEEAQNISTMKVDELIRSLVTFEMTINDKYEKKNKGAAFKVDTEDCEDQVEHDANANLIGFISMLTKNFRKFIRKRDRRYENNVYINVKDNRQQYSKG